MLAAVACGVSSISCMEKVETLSVSSETEVFDPMSLRLTDPELNMGREIWMQTCSACHLRGLVGAPKIGDKESWKPRVDKGMETLFDHAINGYIGPSYTEMPAKGGFSNLTDQEVMLAVRFVVAASQ